MMAKVLAFICLLALWDLTTNCCPCAHWKDTDNHLNVKSVLFKSTCPIASLYPGQPPVHLESDINVSPALPRDLPKLKCIFSLYNYLINPLTGGASTYQRTESKSIAKQRLLIALLLLLSGNVQPNPGPELLCSQTPADFKSLPGLKYVHLNVRSLLPKMDMVRIWVKSTGADVVISETWLTKSITNEDINILGFNVFRTDRPKKGGGVAIYVKSRFNASIVLSQSISKQMEFLALDLEIVKSLHITVVGCYRPPSAPKEALDSLKLLLNQINYTELLMAGDFNWDWFNATSDEFKRFCDSVNLTQLVNFPTRPNPKSPDKSTLIALFLTNVPHKFSSLGVFCNDLSDHCVVAACRNTRIPKCKPRIVCRRNLKHLNEQAFHHDLSMVNWKYISLIPDVELAWTFFKDTFMQIINKHAPLKKYRVKGRENPWFSPELADSLHERNKAWDKARQSNSATDWSFFRQLRNKCTSLIKKAKSGYFLSVTTENLNNPQKFWKVIKSLSLNKNTETIPSFVLKDSVPVYDRTEVLNCFNQHFLSSGSLFDSKGITTGNSCTESSMFSGDPFNFNPFTCHEVHKALKALDHRKPPGPDLIEPYFLKLAADFIAEPLSILFNLSIRNKDIPSVWKSAFVLPLLKGGDPAVLTNYRPISNLCVLSKILESLVCDQLKEFLYSNEILSKLQSGFRKKHSTITATMKVINDIIAALDKKQYCASLFIDLSKAFDTVDHAILKRRLHLIGLSEHTVAWFSNYLENRTQCIKYEGLCSEFVTVHKGVPQGSVLGPLLFILYINNVEENVSDANMHFYADDTIIYCFGSSLEQAVNSLQKAFVSVQHSLINLKLVLNAEKTKLMLFSNHKKVPQAPPVVSTLEGNVIEVVHEYKYLGVVIDDSLTFKLFIDKLVRKLKLKLGFFFRNK
uniref:Reverse transcriptase domain-containing protein n=1 Tax=Gouania willdenowi TaxID=441366 RepID=A0A8C5N2E5_GOUWI